MSKNRGRHVTERVYKKSKFKTIIEYFETRKYSTFINEATKFISLNPADLEMIFYRSKAYRKLGKFDECLNDLKIIIQNKNNEFHNIALHELFFVYYYLNDYDRALEVLPLLYGHSLYDNSSLALAELIMKKQLGLN